VAAWLSVEAVQGAEDRSVRELVTPFELSQRRTGSMFRDQPMGMLVGDPSRADSSLLLSEEAEQSGGCNSMPACNRCGALARVVLRDDALNLRRREALREWRAGAPSRPSRRRIAAHAVLQFSQAIRGKTGRSKV
jgi:hypothetical protein